MELILWPLVVPECYANANFQAHQGFFFPLRSAPPPTLTIPRSELIGHARDGTRHVLLLLFLLQVFF